MCIQGRSLVTKRLGIQGSWRRNRSSISAAFALPLARTAIRTTRPSWIASIMQKSAARGRMVSTTRTRARTCAATIANPAATISSETRTQYGVLPKSPFHTELASPATTVRRPTRTVDRTLPNTAGMNAARMKVPTMTPGSSRTSRAMNAASAARPSSRPYDSARVRPRTAVAKSGRLPVMLSILRLTRLAASADGRRSQSSPGLLPLCHGACWRRVYARRPMLGTYACFVAIVAASLAVGQAVFALCGRRRWSWLAPPVGLAVLTAVAWGTIRLPGDGIASAVAIGVLAVAALAHLRGRVAGLRAAASIGLPVALLAVLAASLPFLVEGRFGILGTGLDPDMSQHLFAANRLAHGEGGRLLSEGYPLGPHSLAVAAAQATGASLVHAFDGLQLAIAVLASLTPLALAERLPAPRRITVALLVGLPYMAASYLIQGAFKETMEALFVLAFAVGLHEIGRGSLIAGIEPAARAPRPALTAIPLAALAVGTVYAYSFPGLLWLIGAAGVWALFELGRVARLSSPAAAAALARRATPVAGLSIAVVCAFCAPEIGRMIDFASFETFNPSGPGLGNLFNPISPLEALGIWPSGDFRLDPGDGAMPAAGFYLGELLGLAALAYGLAWFLRRREWAVPSALAAAIALYAYAHFAGTPYQAAKATVMASPLAMLIAVRALLSREQIVELGAVRGAVARTRTDASGVFLRRQAGVGALLAVAFCCAPGACTVLALANGPVGPATYSPALTELRPDLRHGSTLALVSEHLLADEHGRDYVVWELRGGRVCVEAQGAEGKADSPPPPGIAHVVTSGRSSAPYADLRLERKAGLYELWKRHPAPKGPGPCPLIAPGGRANPAGD